MPAPLSGSVFRAQVPVRQPFRLDLTARALQRLSANVVDVVTEDGTYFRALTVGDCTAIICARQRVAFWLEVEIFGSGGSQLLSSLTRMLGTDVDLRVWERRVKAVPWLERLSSANRGLRPPRYPTLWEALAHAIVFQQISIHAAAAIMQRVVVRFSSPHSHRGIQLYPFPKPEAIADASDADLHAAGLSSNKVKALKQAATAVLDASISEQRLQRLESADAIAELTQLRGIGPWSAAVVLLRGLGRLDVFPTKDSGAAASLRLLAARATVDLDTVLLELGDQRGMLYFHLLLGRLAHEGRKK